MLLITQIMPVVSCADRKSKNDSIIVETKKKSKSIQYALAKSKKGKPHFLQLLLSISTRAVERASDFILVIAVSPIRGNETSLRDRGGE